MTRRLDEPPSRTVAEIARPTMGDRIRVRLLGEQPSHLDLRVFDTTRTSCGEPRPSETGICIRLEQLGDLIAALQAAEKERGR